MSRAIVHRGPDDEGFWTSTSDARGNGALLAFRRLAILDLSPSGKQPMVDPVTGHVVVFNGEIYNYLALRERLASEGQAFRSSGDTEVMLRALSLHGPDAVRWLRGMFAFGMWDERHRRLMLARDALGIKPLYVACNPERGAEWSVVFASEVRAILASGLLGAPRLNPRAASAVVWNGFMVAPETAISGIESLWPGELRLFGSDGRQEHAETFWQMPPAASGASATSEQDIEAALHESVRLHLASDVPLGVFLSGGVDSSAVANVAQKSSRAPIHTFTLAFREQERDESGIARRVAEAIGTEHHEIVLTEQDFIDRLEEAVDSLDQPSFDGLNAYYMSHAVRQAGFKVALVGTGGDEMFGGYTSFRDLRTLARWSGGAQWVPPRLRTQLAAGLSHLLQRRRGAIPPQTRWAKLPGMAARVGDLVALYQLAYALFLPDFQERLLQQMTQDGMADGLPGAMRRRLEAETTSRSALAAISVLEQRMFLGERLLRDTDAASMAVSLEVRLPLVDQALLERAMCLPDETRFLPLRRKAILRRIGLKGLDPALFERPKAGFELPFDRWLRTRLGKVIDTTMRDADAVAATGLNPEAVGLFWQAYLDGAAGVYWTRVWAIYMYIRWCHRHGAYV